MNILYNLVSIALSLMVIGVAVYESTKEEMEHRSEVEKHYDPQKNGKKRKAVVVKSYIRYS